VVGQALQLADLIKRTVEQSGLAGLLQPLPDQVERWLRGRYGDLLENPRAALSGAQLWSRASGVVGTVLAALASATHLLVELGLMLVALFFFLRDGSRLMKWIRDNVPLPAAELDSLLQDLRGVSKSVVAGHVATGAVQAGIATLGYVIAGVPSALLFGLLTFIASFIPSVGTAVAGLPAIGLLVILHRGGWAIFLAAWMVLLVGTLDNLLRPLFMRGGAGHLHGALVFFSLIGGMLMFGPMGLVVGPLGLVFFLAMARAVTRASRSGERAAPAAAGGDGS
jgi:predicted PurR-regulated permease PerM